MINWWWHAPVRSSASSPSRSLWRNALQGFEGRYVSLKETVRGFREILDGKCDDLPEQAFMMAGTIDDVREKADYGKGCVKKCQVFQCQEIRFNLAPGT
jgi:hypothetical protein